MQSRATQGHPAMDEPVTGARSSNPSGFPEAFALKLLTTCLLCCLPFHYLFRQPLISLRRRTEKKSASS